MKKEVIYVDDEVINLYVFEQSYARDFTIRTFSAGREVIDYIQEKGDSVSVLVTDMRMPAMDGIQLIEEVQAINPDIKVIIISGYPYDDQIKQAVEGGKVFQFFSKPYSTNQVRDSITKALSG
jgi:DNA-binding NtrC family response regulator